MSFETTELLIERCVLVSLTEWLLLRTFSSGSVT